LSTSSSSSFTTENSASLTNSNSDQPSKSNNSSCILSNSLENYDQVYFLPSSSTNSNSSKTGSSAYLISPLDESGYLVPINNINSSQFSNEKSTEIAFRLSKKLNNNHHLTRSFSTRSAFSGSQFQSKNKDLKNNRATICEQQITNNAICHTSDDLCLKCNSKLDKQEKVSKWKENLNSYEIFAPSFNLDVYFEILFQ
jgi:hypothetical protein